MNYGKKYNRMITIQGSSGQCISICNDLCC